jgi:GNAT superfamily N-acetyltransferase
MQRDDAPPTVRTADPADRARALAVLTLGFAADPFNRWLFPDGQCYLEAFPSMANAFGGRAFDVGTAWIGADCEGVALWLPPGVEPDRESLMAVVLGNVSEPVALDLAEVGRGMGEFHAQAGDCWYLPLIAVDPLHQGRGVGARLLVEALRRIDATGAPAYLESSNPRNVSLYRRHGFEVMGEIRAGSSPAMVPMYRAPRGQSR